MTRQEKIENLEMVKNYIERKINKIGFIKESDIEIFLLENEIDEMLDTVLNMLSIKYNSTSKFCNVLNTALEIYYYKKDIIKFDNINDMFEYFKNRLD
jgi:hypothetical protein